MHSLVGYTGFVGSNLAASHKFDGLYNSGNIAESFDTRPDLLVYAGIRAEKFLANSEPERDSQVIKNAFDNIVRIAPQQLVLISTIDVYKIPVGVNEDANMVEDGLHPYGLNRLRLEHKIRAEFRDALIVRLPALFGKNLKKNFLFDLKNPVPSVLAEVKFAELSSREPRLASYYYKEGFFYKVRERSPELAGIFKHLDFSPLHFTDSRAQFQFYHLVHLWDDIFTALALGRTLQNMATEPVLASEIYKYENILSAPPPNYDFRTKYSDSGYMYDKDFVLNEIREFLK